MKRTLLSVAIGMAIMAASVGTTFAACFYIGITGSWGGWYNISQNEQEDVYTCGSGCSPINDYFSDCTPFTQYPTVKIREYDPNNGWVVIYTDGHCQDSTTTLCIG